MEMEIMDVKHIKYFCLYETHVVRFRGFINCIKLFNNINNEESPVWQEFINLIKNFVTENHEATKKKGLEAALLFVEKASCAKEIVNEVVPEVIKCFTIPNDEIKNLSIELLLSFIKIGQYEIVENELLIGSESDDLQIVACCISTLTIALQQFDTIIINSSVVIEKLPEFLENQDESIRWKAIELTVELYRLFGSAVIDCLNMMDNHMMVELVDELLKLDNTDYVRSSQNTKSKNSIVQHDNNNNNNGDDQDLMYEVDEEVVDKNIQNNYENHQDILNDDNQDNTSENNQDDTSEHNQDDTSENKQDNTSENKQDNTSENNQDNKDSQVDSVVKIHNNISDENSPGTSVENYKVSPSDKSYQEHTKPVEIVDVIDPYDLIDPVNILSKLPPDFHIKLLTYSFPIQKTALLYLKDLTEKHKKLESGVYFYIIGSLNNIISNEGYNYELIILAAKCVIGLANGLRQRFQIHSANCLSVVFNKFRMQEPCIVAILRETADAIYQSMNIDSILEIVVMALNNNWNASIKSEIAGFISRCLTTTPATSLNNNLLRIYTQSLIGLLDDRRVYVRNSGIETLGKFMSIVGDKKIMPFLSNLHQKTIDNIIYLSQRN
ncbi:hypothetical protein HCN44_005019 [Aphidius gifuensis]|uniref:TOG domain-containing protein n=1 Tax=Aphidius gifuensis TaxID=684658 RepID=A0A835CTU5_APHGI|nr:protein mini spindles-like [Aphidius gifuensis]KAF7992675.1 hypothetical protein HCN44_005019 [Aphidius gifuensis]